MTDKTSDDQHLCWNCKTDVGFQHFCNTCIKIQPTPSSEDYFSFFELPKKLSIDAKALQTKFYELSKKLHPDSYQQATEQEKQIALEKSSILNKAYEIVKDPWLRAGYMLDVENFSKKNMDQKTPPELLAEMFEIQEHVDTIKEAKRSPISEEELKLIERDLNESLGEVQSKIKIIESKLQSVFKEWDADSSNHEKLALEIQKLIHERKYLETARQTVESALES